MPKNNIIPGLTINGEPVIAREIGKVIYLEDKVFVCPKCKQRYDFAIIYNEYPDEASCKICNSKVEIDNASLRFAIPHPKKGGW